MMGYLKNGDFKKVEILGVRKDYIDDFGSGKLYRPVNFYLVKGFDNKKFEVEEDEIFVPLDY